MIFEHKVFDEHMLGKIFMSCFNETKESNFQQVIIDCQKTEKARTKLIKCESKD